MWDDVLKKAGLPHAHAYAFNVLRAALDFFFKNTAWTHRRVVFPAFICPIVVEVALRNKLTPVLVDVDLDTFHLEPEGLGKMNLDTVDAVLVNHTFGFPADVDALKKIANAPSLLWVEDKAHGWFTEGTGASSDAVLLSLYKQVKNHGGGLLVTQRNMDESYGKITRTTDAGSVAEWVKNRTLIKALIRFLRKHKGLYQAVPVSKEQWTIAKPHPRTEARFQKQWDGLRKEVARRRHAFSPWGEWMDPRYGRAQGGDLERASCSVLSWRLIGDAAEKRDEVLRALRKDGIFLDRMWYNAPAILPEYAPYLHGACDNARTLARTIINLPVTPETTADDVKKVIEKIHRILK